MSKSFAVETMNEAMADITRVRSNLATHRYELQLARKQIIEIIKMVCPKPIGSRWESEYSLSCSVDGTYCTPVVSFYLDGLDSFKDERLVSKLWFLSNLDGSREASSSDYAAGLNRTYRFSFDRFDVRVDATVKSDSPTCRKVVVSSELVKKDVYAIQCD